MLDLNKVKFILGKQKIAYLYKLLFLILLGGLMDSLSVALILPVLDIILLKKNFSFLNYEINFTYFDYEKTIIIVLSTIIILYILKNFYLRFLLVKQTNFISNMKAEISLKIYKKYIEFDQIFFLRSNSAIFFRNLKSEARIFVAYYLNSLLNLFLDSIFIFFLIIILASVDIFLFLICFFIFITASLIYFLFYKKYIAKIGANRQTLEGNEFKIIQETFRNIKEIKFYNANNFFLNLYKKTVYSLAKYAAQFGIIAASLKYYFEIFLVFSLSIIIVFMVHKDYTQDQIIVTIGIFAAASVRLIPSINKIIVALQNLRYSKKSLEEVYLILSKQEEMAIQKQVIRQIKFFNEIELKNVSFQYPEDKIPIIKNLSLKIKQGTIIGIFGKSGSGKTTLLNIISGLLENYEGSILSDQIDIKQNIFNWRSNFSYVTQNLNLNDTTIASNIAFGVENELIDHDKLVNSSKFSKIFNFIDSLPKKFDSKVGELGSRLSGGEIQRIVIARAIYKGSKILILDEATNSLNKEIEDEIISDLIKLKKNKITILFSTHNLNLKKYFDQIIEI